MNVMCTPHFDIKLDFQGKTPSAPGLGSNFAFVEQDVYMGLCNSEVHLSLCY
jgi:hypothetical protein